MKRFIFVAAIVLSVATVTFGRPSKVVRLGREFKLRAGQQVTLKEGNLRIKLDAVEDSRCPRGVTCVWAGNGQVTLTIGKRGGRGESLTLNTMGIGQMPSEGKYKSYKVKLVELSPYPRDGQEIAAGDYTATLVVSKE